MSNPTLDEGRVNITTTYVVALGAGADVFQYERILRGQIAAHCCGNNMLIREFSIFLGPAANAISGHIGILSLLSKVPVKQSLCLSEVSWFE